MVRRSLRSMERAGKEQQLSMGEIIDRMAQDTESHEPKDTRQRYKGICPVCGKENWICKSLAMEMGINTGVGRCLGCDTFLHITYNPAGNGPGKIRGLPEQQESPRRCGQDSRKRGIRRAR